MVFCEAPLDAAAFEFDTSISAPALDTTTKGAGPGCGANKKREEEEDEDVVRVVRSAAPPVTEEARAGGPETKPVVDAPFGGLQCLHTVVFRID